LVTGACGILGHFIMHELMKTGANVHGWFHHRCNWPPSVLSAVDLSDTNMVHRAFRKNQPDLIIHTAAMSNATRCLLNEEAAWHVNAEGTALLAELADANNARIVFTSTDWVFDGVRGGYSELDTPCPTTIYGETKLFGEKSVVASRAGVVVRLSLLFGYSQCGQTTGFDKTVEAIKAGRGIAMCDDEWRTPLRYTLAAKGLIAIVHSDFLGVIHMAGRDRISRFDMGHKITELLGADLSLCRRISRRDLEENYPRPEDTSLNTNLWRELFPNLVDHGIDKQLADELGNFVPL
jgi:dTDP-4-dehydrorhamnose reductase